MKKIISLILVLVLSLSLACTVYASDFVASPGGTPEDCEHGKTTIVGRVEPTCTTDGYTGDVVCDDCGKVLEQGTVIPKLGHNFVDGVCTICGVSQDNPQTGDNSNIVLWAGIMAAAVVGLGAVIVIYRKKFANQ